MKQIMYKKQKNNLRGNMIAILLVWIVASMAVMVVSENVQAASGVALSKTYVSIKIGQKTNLKVKNTKGKKVQWSTKNKKVAIVSNKGVVTGKGVGTTVIIAKVCGKVLKCTVKVSPVHLYGMNIFHSAEWHEDYSKWTAYSDTLGYYYPNSIIVTYDGANDKNNNSLEFYIGRKYDTLTGKLAFSGENVKEAGELQMVIYGDDCELYRSQPFDERTEPEKFSINVSGVSFLKFSVEVFSGTGNNGRFCNDMLLIDPILG